METHRQISIIFSWAVPLWFHFGEKFMGCWKMYLNFKFMHLGDLEGLECTKQDRYLLTVLLVGCKKTLTRKWLKKDKPTIRM